MIKISTGDIILIPYPFAELINIKLRPAAVICLTSDIYHDLVVSAISSVQRDYPEKTTLILNPTLTNNLKVVSTLLIDRIFTLKQENLYRKIGKLDKIELELFIKKFRNLPDLQ